MGIQIRIQIIILRDVGVEDRTHRSTDAARIEVIDLTVDQNDVMEIKGN